jgi:hypothetical protein
VANAVVGTWPADDGFGAHDDDRVEHRAEDASGESEHDPISCTDAGLWHGTTQDDDLLAKDGVFDKEGGAGSEGRTQRGQDGLEDFGKHRGTKPSTGRSPEKFRQNRTLVRLDTEYLRRTGFSASAYPAKRSCASSSMARRIIEVLRKILGAAYTQAMLPVSCRTKPLKDEPAAWNRCNINVPLAAASPLDGTSFGRRGFRRHTTTMTSPKTCCFRYTRVVVDEPSYELIFAGDHYSLRFEAEDFNRLLHLFVPAARPSPVQQPPRVASFFVVPIWVQDTLVDRHYCGEQRHKSCDSALHGYRDRDTLIQ